jgi:hypothetical protein
MEESMVRLCLGGRGSTGYEKVPGERKNDGMQCSFLNDEDEGEKAF